MEINRVEKNPLKVSARVAYVYPSLYQVMISGLAPDIIYFMLNTEYDVYVERFHNKKLRGAEDEPRSLETSSPLRDFDLILTSLHYELDIVNLIRLLKPSGLSPFRTERDIPIIAGGPAVMENPIPYADVIDAFVIGEAEAALPPVIEKFLEYGDNKGKFLEEIAGLDFVYVPGLNDGMPRKRRYVEDLNSAFFPLRQIINTDVEPIYGKGFKYEASRGCISWCSFCMESRVLKPYRERSNTFFKEAIPLIKELYFNRAVIFSLSFPTTKGGVELLRLMAEEGLRGSLPSLRLGDLLFESLDYIKAIGQRTLTIAPESFSFRLRRVLAKNLMPDDELVDKIAQLVKSGFDLKIYMIYGVKGSGPDDIRRDVEFLRMLGKIARSFGRKIKVSLNPLVPKPHTPFQWIGMEAPALLKSYLKTYREELGNLIEARPYDVDWAVIQASVALSDKPLGRAFVEIAERGGSLSAWKGAVAKEGLLKRALRGYEIGEELPWGFIRDDISFKVAVGQHEAFRQVLGRRE